MEIHERIKILRIQRHLSQKHVANNLGVSSSEVAQMESGTRGIMAEDLQKLCVLFRVSADTLLFDEIPEMQSAEIARRIESLNDRDQAEIMNIIHFKEQKKASNEYLPIEKKEEIEQKAFVEAAQCLGNSMEATIATFQEHFNVRPSAASDAVQKYWKRNGPRIQDLDGISTGVVKNLKRAGYFYVGDILSIENKQAFLKIQKIGQSSYEMVINAIEEKGYDVSHLKR